MNYINGHLIIFMLLALVIMPLVTAEILRLLGNYTKQRLVDNFGNNSQIVIGGLGVIIHELAHLITACIFLHCIGKFSLLEPRAYQYTGNLGYVNHYWHAGNLYESLGNFFTGLAPCFVCSEVLWMIHGFLFSTPTYNYSGAYNLSGAFKLALTNVMYPFGNFSWQLIIYLILIVMISSTGYGLSSDDMRNVYSGLPYWIGLLIIIYILVAFLGLSSGLITLLWKATVMWLTFLGLGLIYIVTSLIVIDFMAFCKNI